MEYNERNITAVEVFKKLEEVEKQNKGYCKAVEDMCNLLKALGSQKAVLKKNK